MFERFPNYYGGFDWKPAPATKNPHERKVRRRGRYNKQCGAFGSPAHMRLAKQERRMR